MAGSDQLYEIEDLVAKRKKGNITEYFVKWKGFDSSENSWEPATSLHNCQDMMDKLTKSASPARTPSRSTTPTRRTKSPTKSKAAKASTPTRARSRSRNRATSKSPARAKKSSRRSTSESPAKTRVMTRSRSRSRPRTTGPVSDRKPSPTPAPKEQKVVRARSKSSTRRSTTTVTKITTRKPADQVDSKAGGDTASTTHTSTYQVKKTELQPVVVPKSLQAPRRQVESKGFLDQVTARDVVLILVVAVVVGLTLAHNFHYINLNEYMQTLQAKLQPYLPKTSREPVPSPKSTSPPPTSPPPAKSTP